MGLVDTIGVEAALLTLPFAIFGLLWALGHLAFGNGTTAEKERVEPPSPNRQRRPIPGGRGDKSD